MLASRDCEVDDAAYLGMKRQKAVRLCFLVFLSLFLGKGAGVRSCELAAYIIMNLSVTKPGGVGCHMRTSPQGIYRPTSTSFV